MRIKTIIKVFVLTISSCAFAGNNTKVLENKYLKREVTIENGVLKTSGIENKKAKKILQPLANDEIVLRISKDASKTEGDIVLKSVDFNVVNFSGNDNEIVAELENQKYQLNIKVHYTLNPEQFYGHKYLEIVSKQFWIAELIDIESISFDDAYQPYRAKDMMWTNNKFLPALGQPLYTSNTATFWGVEFPASWNRVENKTIRCGYQAAVEIEPNKKYTTYKAVFGVSEDGNYIKEDFLTYIDQIRANPFGLHVQYNSWFDFGGGVTQQKFLESLNSMHKELVEKRGCKPLDVYVIDDAWQNSRPNRSPLADWSKGMYQVNDAAFDPGLKTVRAEIEKRGSKMGLWASPACLFGATDNINVLQEKGFETLVGSINKKTEKAEKSMSMTGPKYMDLVEEALLRMARMGSVYFKLDGIFGNMKYRWFPVEKGLGTPVMSELLPNGILANDPRLNDPKYDEMKRYYITRSTIRLVDIYQKMLQINPKIRIMNHNGATISPWWLMTSDVISLVNQQDGAPGEDRNTQMCYRDGIYYQTVVTDNNQIPINTIFNHEPSKDKGRFGDKNISDFRNYFFMSLSRGSSMVELYVQIKALESQDYDVIAEGLKWLYEIYPAFKRSRMHGGNPLGKNVFNEKNVSVSNINIDMDASVYGYTGWNESMGYVSIHNPKATKESYTFTLNRDFGLIENTNSKFALTSPMADKINNLKKSWSYGDKITIEVAPKDVVILNFKLIK